MILADFKNIHTGMTAYIIGKGPSLDHIESIKDRLSAEDAVIFCLNESIHKIETLFLPTVAYAVQQDSEIGADAKPRHSVHFMNEIQGVKGFRTAKKKVDVSPHNPDAVLYGSEIAASNEFSAIAALRLAKYMGIVSVVFCCFDSWNGDNDYAKCIGKDSGEFHSKERHQVDGCWIREMARVIMARVSTLLPEMK